MIHWILIAVLNFTGFNFAFWATISLLRWLIEEVWAAAVSLLGVNRNRDLQHTPSAIKPEEVAVVMAAHNEEIALPATLEPLMAMLPAANIFIGSDASSDHTVKIAKQAGVNVLDLQPNRGKAKTIVATLNHFKVMDRFKGVFLIDADVIADRNFLKYALPFFDDPKVAAVAGHAFSLWHKHWPPRWSWFFAAYRVRLWRILQYTVRYGQNWKYMNMATIVPGGSSIYRSDVLRQIQIDAPGLIIEDFNMTFEIRHKNLGKVAYHPRAFVIDHEPYRLRDYYRQVYRWHLGWWQTVIRHGFWPSTFWFSTSAYQLELIFYAFFVLGIPIMLAAYAVNGFQPLGLQFIDFRSWKLYPVTIPFGQFFATVFLVDYLVTAIVAFIEKKPILSIYGLGFIFIRIIDVFTFVWALPVAIFKRSQGQWVSPRRRSDSPLLNSK